MQPAADVSGARRGAFCTRAQSSWWSTGAVVATAVIAVCAARAIHDGVQLTDERALFEIRARDVFSGRSPLLGLRSSAGGTDDGFNHLGPVLFWWLAIPVRLWSGPVAVTIGIAALNVTSVWCAVISALQAAGRVVAFAIGAAATALTWSMGSDLLIDPWQPNALVFPFYALLATTAAVAAGRWNWLPVVVAFGSFCALTHLGYVILGPAMVVAAVGSVVLTAARSGPDERRWPRRALIASAIVAAVVWSPVVWQQFFGPGRGNLTAVLGGAGSDEAPRTGVGIAVRLWADVVMVPPGWLPPTYRSPPQAIYEVVGDEARLDTSHLPPTWLAVVVLAVAFVIALRLLRGSRRVTAAYVWVALVATVVAIGTITVLPADLFGVVAHKYRYLWPLGAFCAAVTVALVVIALRHRWTNATQRVLGWGAAAAVAVVGFLATATRPLDDGAFTSRQLWPSLVSVRDQLAEYSPAGPVEVETDNLPFPDYYSHAVLAQLSANGTDVHVTTPTMVGQLGESRASDGGATVRIVIDQSDSAPPPGTRLLARTDLPDAPPVRVYEVALEP